VIDVVGAVAAPAAIDAPNAVDITDAELGTMGATLSFSIRNSLAGVFGYLATLGEVVSSKAALAVDR
jgi:hypothetical protein